MKWILIICLSFTMISKSFPEEKLRIKINFRILEKEYIDFYTAAEISAIEKRAADSMALLFNEYIPMFQFVTGNGSEDSLQISLVRREGGSDYLFYIDWKLQIRGKNVKPANKYTWNFAESTNYENPLNEDPLSFVNYLCADLYEEFEKDIYQTDFINEIFQNVKMAREAEQIDLVNKKWVLPYTYQYLNIGWQTEFKLEHIFRDNSVDVFRSFDCQASGVNRQDSKIVLFPSQGIGNISAGNFKSLEGIYITRYNPFNLR